MKVPRRQFLHLAAGAAASPALPRVANAQAYPSRPITLVVPLAAGGGMTKGVGTLRAFGLEAKLAVESRR
jgi:hypothetical protein